MRQNIKCANIFHMNTDVFAVRTRERNCHGDEEQVFCSKTESSAGGALKGYGFSLGIIIEWENSRGQKTSGIGTGDHGTGSNGSSRNQPKLLL